MRTGVIFAFLIALCLLLGPIGSIPSLTALPSQPSSPEAGELDTILEIKIQSDGDARISIVTRVPVHGENGMAAYKQSVREFKVKSIKMMEIKTFFHQVVNETSNATGRPMLVKNFTRNTTLSDNVGKFIYSFTWKNFAVVVEDKGLITLNDSFKTTSGMWLPGLSRNLTLTIRPPQGYYIKVSPIPHQGQTLRWTGPKSFKPGFPNITYARSVPQDQLPPPSVTPSVSGSGPWGSVSPFMFAVGTAVLITIGSIGIFAFSRRKRVLTNVTTDGGVGTEGVERTSVSPSRTDSESASDPAPVLDSNPDPDLGPETDTNIDPDREPSDAGIDLGLLSDEERVERLLRRNDGRMKQASIVQETDWSDAKVSQLLSSMDEEDRIEKLRIGRENLITLSDYDTDSD